MFQLLDLSYCQLPHILDLTLSEMPNLHTLDISENFLINIEIATISHLQYLEKIQLHGNSIECKNLQDFLAFLDGHSVRHTSDCVEEDNSDIEMIENNGNIQKQSNQFEKMIDWASYTTKKPESSWIFEDIITNQGVEEKECPQPVPDTFLQRVIAISPIIVLSMCVVSGFLVGLILGCLCRFKKPVRRPRHRKPIHRISRSFSIRGGQVHDREFLIEQ